MRPSGILFMAVAWLSLLITCVYTLSRSLRNK